MISYGNLALVALVVLAARVQAEPAFVVSGMHTEMVFSDAVARAESFGGVCERDKSPSRGGGVVAYCKYPSCAEGEPPEECDKQPQQTPGLTVAAQPVTQIVLEAPAASSTLTRMFITFEGSVESVEESLRREYGQPDNDNPAGAPSWSHDRRLHWTSGKDNLGLRTQIKTVLLAPTPVIRQRDPDAT